MFGFMRSINIISRCGTAFRGQRLEGSGLTGCQCPYVLIIEREPGITQEEIAGRLHIHKSNVARQLAAMETAGLIERKENEQDRRALSVYPAPKLMALLPSVHEVMREWTAYLIGALTKEEEAQMRELLDRVARRAEEYERGLAR